VSFGVTSVLCGLAPTLELLVLARVLQGAAGALLVPGSLSILTATFEGREQGRAFGIWAGASSATTILGPVVGGVLVTTTSWRAAFLINLPLCALALWATLRHVAETRDEEATGRFDWLGAAVVAVAVGGLTFGVIRGEAQQWQSPEAFVSLALGAVAAIAWPFLMARRPDPLVPLTLFRSRNFSVTNASTLLIYGAIYVMVQFLALFAIGILGYNEVGFGVAVIPSEIFLAFFSTRIGELADRFGPRWFMAIGPAIMALGLMWFVRMPADSAPWRLEPSQASTWLPPADFAVDVLPAMVLFGLGLLIMVAPLTTALMRSVPVRRSGVASAFNNAVSRVGPQLAGALLFIVISTTFSTALQDRLSARTGPVAERQLEQVTPLNAPPPSAPPSVARAAREASTEAFRLAMGVAALMCLGGAAINAVGIRNRDCEPAPDVQPVAPCPQSPPVESRTA
jgi:MFS family permease